MGSEDLSTGPSVWSPREVEGISLPRDRVIRGLTLLLLLAVTWMHGATASSEAACGDHAWATASDSTATGVSGAVLAHAMHAATIETGVGSVAMPMSTNLVGHPSAASLRAGSTSGSPSTGMLACLAILVALLLMATAPSRRMLATSRFSITSRHGALRRWALPPPNLHALAVLRT